MQLKVFVVESACKLLDYMSKIVHYCGGIDLVFKADLAEGVVGCVRGKISSNKFQVNLFYVFSSMQFGHGRTLISFFCVTLFCRSF